MSNITASTDTLSNQVETVKTQAKTARLPQTAEELMGLLEGKEASEGSQDDESYPTLYVGSDAYNHLLSKIEELSCYFFWPDEMFLKEYSSLKKSPKAEASSVLQTLRYYFASRKANKVPKTRFHVDVFLSFYPETFAYNPDTGRFYLMEKQDTKPGTAPKYRYLFISNVQHEIYMKYRQLMEGYIGQDAAFEQEFFKSLRAHERLKIVDPIGDYLRRLPEVKPGEFSEKTGVDPWFMAEHLFGEEAPIVNLGFLKWLQGLFVWNLDNIRGATVEQDMFFILYSLTKGKGKTRFLRRVLPDPEWSVSTYGASADKSFFENVIGRGVVNVDECQSTLTGRNQNELKNLISKPVYPFRAAYAPAVVDYKRTVIYAGTSNDKDLIADPLGDRRYIVAEVVKDSIEIDWWVNNRDLCLGFIKWMWQAGKANQWDSSVIPQGWTCYHYFTSAECALAVAHQQDGYMAEQSWQALMEGMLNHLQAEMDAKGITCYAVKPQDIQIALKQSTEGAKKWEIAVIRDICIKLGASMKRPKLVTGKQASKAILVFGSGEAAYPVSIEMLQQGLDRYRKCAEV